MTEQAASNGQAEDSTAESDIVRYETRGRTAVITLNRPRYRNAQNSAVTYALDAALTRAVNDDDVAVLVLAGEGDHFCAGHDIGTPGRDIDASFERKAVMWWDHVGKQGWVCDLIVASDDAFFADPVVRMGIPGVEYFAHPWVLGPRFAKEMLFTGDRFDASRAYQLGMVSRVVPRAELAEVTFALADRIADMPAFGLALAKRAVNQCEDQMGMRNGMDSVFGLHHVAHAHNAETGTDSLAGMTAATMKKASG